MNYGLSETLLRSFPNILKINRPSSIKYTDLDSNWFAGFVEAEGCFSINISTSKNSKLGYAVSLSPSLLRRAYSTQNTPANDPVIRARVYPSLILTK
jgi:hypothetical protein